MTKLQAIDNIHNHNDLLISLESQLEKESLNKEILIRELFVLWHILLEGIKCEDFSSQRIEELLRSRDRLFRQVFNNDSDFNFLTGWMLTIAPWYFNQNLTEDDGYRLLYKAYRSNPKNSLYKWALRGQLVLSEGATQELNHSIKKDFNLYFDYGSMIKEYFIAMLN